MKKVIIVIFVILAAFAKAQDKQVVIKNPNGSIKEIGFITSDGKKDSTWVRYDETGKVLGKASFTNGLKNGLWETYNDKGIKLYEIVYENNTKKYGRHWDENGILIETKEY